MPDQEQINARNAVRSMGGDALPALMLLFEQHTSNQYRAAVVDAMKFNKGDKSVAAAFLTKKLSIDASRWDGRIWIPAALAFLTEVDPGQARTLALRALDCPDLDIQYAGLKSLGQLGNIDDLQRLQSIVARRRSLNTNHGDDDLSRAAAKAIEQINGQK